MYVCYLKELQTLKVRGSSLKGKKIADDFSKRILPAFSHLQELRVIGCEEGFDDTCMEILGTHCQDLR